jgi:hypothetical protein
MANTQAYYGTATFTAVKRFIVQAKREKERETKGGFDLISAGSNKIFNNQYF